MLLKQLYEFAEQQRGNVAPPMFEKRRIPWIIPLGPDGTFLGALERTCGKGNNPSLGKCFWAPYEYRGSGSNPRLLADTAEFVLGLVPAGRDPQVTAARHAAFIREVARCAAFTGKATIHAVEHFLRTWKIREWQPPKHLYATDNVTFRVGQIYPIQDPEIGLYWKMISNRTTDHGAHRVCTICGQVGTGAKTRHFKIRNLANGRASGLSLVSANIPAAESYGLASARGVPTCSHCEDAIYRAINYLISSPDSKIVSGPTTYIFWANKRREFNLKSLLVDPDPSEVHALAQAAFAGDRSVIDFESSPFNVAGLSTNCSRVVVRDWIGTSLAELKRNLSRFFHLQQLIGIRGDPAQPIGLLGLTAGYGASHSQSVLQQLIRLAVEGGALPMLPLVAAIQRNGRENRVTRPRAALIKMVILSKNLVLEEKRMVELDPENRHPGYVCGRLLAVLQRIQWIALGNINASLVDRFFSTASAAPRIVFPRLLRLSQAHLRKIHEHRPSSYFALQTTLEQLIQNLHEFPAVLSMVDQGLFALGYYHQRAFDRSCAQQRLANHEGRTHSDVKESETTHV